MYFGAFGALPAFSPFIGAQAGANDLAIGPGFAAYPAANATVYRVYEYAVPVTTVATVPSAFPTTAGLPGIAAYPGAGGFGI
ncbi:MAG TPA: hypothetical protein VK464_29185 [Symbiobacteriaceae bacterium]|jgi:hypothetical protein|nr:hypothetical protein [Symbiobacteriaceae bacterium]